LTRIDCSGSNSDICASKSLIVAWPGGAFVWWIV